MLNFASPTHISPRWTPGRATSRVPARHRDRTGPEAHSARDRGAEKKPIRCPVMRSICREWPALHGEIRLPRKWISHASWRSTRATPSASLGRDTAEFATLIPGIGRQCPAIVECGDCLEWATTNCRYPSCSARHVKRWRGEKPSGGRRFAPAASCSQPGRGLLRGDSSFGSLATAPAGNGTGPWRRGSLVRSIQRFRRPRISSSTGCSSDSPARLQVSAGSRLGHIKPQGHLPVAPASQQHRFAEAVTQLGITAAPDH